MPHNSSQRYTDCPAALVKGQEGAGAVDGGEVEASCGLSILSVNIYIAIK
jgi:hypothetical protein